jgi:hypothetical protein
MMNDPNNNPMAGMMGNLMNQQQSLISMFEQALAKQGINVKTSIQGNKVLISFPPEEIQKLFIKNMPPQLQHMVNVEKVGEMVLSIRLG